MRIPQRFRHAVAIVLVTLIAVVAIGEGGLRAIHYRVLNHYKLDRAFSSPGAFKILFVGDSFTAGGRTESGLGYPEHIERKLDAMLERDNENVDVINIALAGTATFIHRLRLDSYLDRNAVKPDLVFIITGCNNF